MYIATPACGRAGIMLTIPVAFFAIHQYIALNNFNVCPWHVAWGATIARLCLLIERNQFQRISPSSDTAYTREHILSLSS